MVPSSGKNKEDFTERLYLLLCVLYMWKNKSFKVIEKSVLETQLWYILAM